MARHIDPDDFDRLLGIFAALAQPADLRAVSEALQPSWPKRTLQRRLAQLVSRGSLQSEGAGRATRYRLERPATVVAEDSPPLAGHSEIPLSSESAKIRRSVRAQLSHRAPIGYRRRFLDGYRPNEAAYLSQKLRQHLAQQGSTPGGELPAGTHARKVFDRLLIDLSWNSSRLEGNTYTLLETERLLKLGQSAEGKSAREAQMILNHKAAIELLVDQADEIGFNRYSILNLHALLADNLLSDPQSVGRLRTIRVGITGTVFQPLESPPGVEECFDQILATATAIDDPFEQAFFAMVQLPYLQPFEDVNKRVSRLAANIPLIRENLCPLSFVGVPERDYVDGILGVYELNKVELLRDVFVRAYERSCARYADVQRSLGEPDPFRMKYRSALTELVRAVLLGKMDRAQAVRYLRREVEARAPEEERRRFVELAETELMSLHEGNFARYRVRPSEFAAWQAGWR